MPSCERCWSDSRMRDITGVGPTYQDLLAERGPAGCTPEQQAGPDARVCATCGRRAIHQICSDWCMACNAQRETKRAACRMAGGAEVKALSLTQPWPWIIFHLGKRIENRSRNLGNYRGTLLLHASKGMTRADYQSALNFVFQRFGREAAEKVPGLDSPLLVRGAIVGVCEVVDQIAPEDAHGYARAHGGLGSEFDQPEELFPPGQEPWYMGAHAYVLDDVRELTAPIHCKGALGLWTPPAEVVSQVRTWMLGGERP